MDVRIVAGNHFFKIIAYSEHVHVPLCGLPCARGHDAHSEAACFKAFQKLFDAGKNFYQLIGVFFLKISVHLRRFPGVNLRKLSFHSKEKRFAEARCYLFQTLFPAQLMHICVLPGSDYHIIGVYQSSVKIEKNRVYHFNSLILSWSDRPFSCRSRWK